LGDGYRVPAGFTLDQIRGDRLVGGRRGSLEMKVRTAVSDARILYDDIARSISSGL
jgi:hypothetical protein